MMGNFDSQLIFWMLGGAFSMIIGVFLVLNRSKANKTECVILHRQIDINQERSADNFGKLFNDTTDIKQAVARIEAKLS